VCAADSSVTRAIRYLEGAQNSNGGLGPADGSTSTQLHTSWATIGFAAAGRNPNSVKNDNRTPVGYIMRNLADVRGIADVERTILALRAAGRSVRSVSGRRLVTELVRKQRKNGSFAGLVNQTAFAILALRATKRSPRNVVIRRAVSWLARQRNRDGGFNFSGKGGPSGIDDTAAALQALVAAGKRSTKTARRAASFLVRQQNADGGMPLSKNGRSNAQSTAWAVQGLVAARRNLNRVRRGGGRNPLQYLRSLQDSNGSIRYSRTSRQTPVWVTAQALTALARKPFPIRAP
jgi:energy-coupling factor transport system substrate-specific component